jgi:hypothetical protein
MERERVIVDPGLLALVEIGMKEVSSYQACYL